MDDAIPDIARKGRGAVSNAAGRFERHASRRIDDGWHRDAEDDLPPLRTQVTRDASRTVI